MEQRYIRMPNAPSTRIRMNLKTDKYLSVFKFIHVHTLPFPNRFQCPHVNAKMIWKRWCCLLSLLFRAKHVSAAQYRVPSACIPLACDFSNLLTVFVCSSWSKRSLVRSLIQKKKRLNLKQKPRTVTSVDKRRGRTSFKCRHRVQS